MTEKIVVVGGVDTHTDVHQAAVIDTLGRHLATAPFSTTPDGYRFLLGWLRAHGDLRAVGVEGTGSHGSALTRFLRDRQVTVVEVDRPDRQARRHAGGKSDPVDAYAAADAVLSGRARGEPKTRDAVVEAIRALRVVRRSAVKARTQTVNQVHSLIISAPAEVRERLRDLPTYLLIGQLARSRPTGELADPACAVRVALRRLARRYQHLTDEITDADAELEALVAQVMRMVENGQGCCSPQFVRCSTNWRSWGATGDMLRARRPKVAGPW